MINNLYINRLPSNIWLHTYFNCIFYIARMYEPSNFEVSSAMWNFMINFGNIMPNHIIKKKINEFINMEHSARHFILSMPELTQFLDVNSTIKNIIVNEPNKFLYYSVNNKNILFMYVYLMYCYILASQRTYNINHKIPTYKNILEKYNPDFITKSDWGRATWYVIHISALYNEQIISQSFMNAYSNWLHSLMHLLPCEVCRSHLRENIKYVPIIGVDNISLFKSTYELHNVVNRSLNKYEPSLDEALSYYSFLELK